jgi:hypothetical protein
MDRNTLKMLQSYNEYPSLSILMPTHRHHPDNQQDPIRLKNLVSEARNRLLKEFKKNDISPLLKNLTDTVDNINYQYTLDGLAIFVNNKTSYKFDLQFPIKERVLIDRSFATRDIVFAMNRTQPYWVLLLTFKTSRLFLGIRDSLVEIEQKGFPFYNRVYENKESSKTGDSFSDRLIDNEEKMRIYFREVEKCLKGFHASKNYPLVLTGTDKNISLYKDISLLTDYIMADIKGNYENKSLHELSRIIWPEAKLGFASNRARILDNLESVMSANKYACGIDEVWQIANGTGGSTLIVEIGYHYPSEVSENGLQLIHKQTGSGPRFLDDAVDEIIEIVISKGGKVAFVDDGKIEKYGHIILILRY